MQAPKKGPRPDKNHSNEAVSEALTFSGVGKINVQTQTGLTDTFTVDFDKEHTDNLKGMIADKYGLNKRDYDLLSGGRLMDDDQKLSYYGLRNGSKVTLQLKMRSGFGGGGKKRKTRKRSHKRKTRKN